MGQRVMHTRSRKIDTSNFWGLYEFYRTVKQMPHYKAFSETKKRFRRKKPAGSD